MMHEALLWKRIDDSVATVRCSLCMRRCVIENGQFGWCATRINQNGTLYTLTYGNVAQLSISTIEKKPLYHFFPGSMWLSLGGVGCNFKCHGCQAWDLSHCDVKKKVQETTYMSPQAVVKKAKQNGCQGVCFTYNEPTMWFEYVLDVFKTAKQEKLSTCLVTNGFMTAQALNMLGEYLDGYCLDVKGSFMESYTRIADVSEINTIFSNGSEAKRRWAMHVEIVTNIIPGYNSSEKELKEIATWIFAELGKDTPWHLTRFFPYGDFKEVAPTPQALLENMRNMAMREGLLYVYIGNIPGHPGAHTYCQKCKKPIIKRLEYDEIENRMAQGHCPHCKTLIFGRFAF
ncbi:MAG: AmmeMemoRadiSam system radical SAM enzyme [Candidatus Omnitrophica bacterium]|nr:AmmeMemoRadiSam system radical SAM enzyme [Candidatus Omnitrophota bacterium]